MFSTFSALCIRHRLVLTFLIASTNNSIAKSVGPPCATWDAQAPNTTPSPAQQRPSRPDHLQGDQYLATIVRVCMLTTVSCHQTRPQFPRQLTRTLQSHPHPPLTSHPPMFSKGPMAMGMFLTSQPCPHRSMTPSTSRCVWVACVLVNSTCTSALAQIKRLQSPDEAAEVFLVENREDGRRYQVKLIERGTLVRHVYSICVHTSVFNTCAMTHHIRLERISCASSRRWWSCDTPTSSS